MVAESKKFKIGDKVISIKNTPEVPEGLVGYIVEVRKNDNFDYAVENLGLIDYFKEDELELLSVAKIPELPVKETIYSSALDKQVSGNHYKDFKIQPVEYIYANNIPFLEANVIKYTSRHRAKNKAADIKKAIHCLELILQMEYGE